MNVQQSGQSHGTHIDVVGQQYDPRGQPPAPEHAIPASAGGGGTLESSGGGGVLESSGGGGVLESSGGGGVVPSYGVAPSRAPPESIRMTPESVDEGGGVSSPPQPMMKAIQITINEASSRVCMTPPERRCHSIPDGAPAGNTAGATRERSRSGRSSYSEATTSTVNSNVSSGGRSVSHDRRYSSFTSCVPT